MQNRDLREYVDFLRRALPEEDRLTLSDAALERVARHALTVREETPWGRDVPEWIFRDYVLFPRINDEFPEAYHAPLWQALRARLAGLSMTEAALEVNVWCAEHVVYQSTDNRTAGPLTTLRRGFGRCGEESTLLTAALRAAGIPARQMYSPRWAHCDDNHAWVEAWLDGRWRYMGACEPEPEPDSGWFTAAASKAMLVHTRAFGEPPEGERVERSFGSFSIVNRTHAYARTRRLTVRVTNGGRPAPGATVRFELANMAELYPISEKLTDARGEAELETGLGTLRVHATDGRRWLAQTADADRVEIDLKEGFGCEPKEESRHPDKRAVCAAEGASKALRASEAFEANRAAGQMGERCAEAEREANHVAAPQGERCAERVAAGEANCAAGLKGKCFEEEAAVGEARHIAASQDASCAQAECAVDAARSEANHVAAPRGECCAERVAAGEVNCAVASQGEHCAEAAIPPVERFVQRPPRETRIQPSVHSEAVARRHAETLRRCERLRAARNAELASDDAVIARARGNAEEIRAFLADARFAESDRRALLSTLREKDLADTSAETLTDALETALLAKGALPEAIWREVVLCPRIADEKLRPVRRALRDALGEGLCPLSENQRFGNERGEVTERGPADGYEAQWAAAPVDGTELSRERGGVFETTRAAACTADKAGSDMSFAFPASDENDGKIAASTHGAGENVLRRDGADGFAFSAFPAARADGAAVESQCGTDAPCTVRADGAVSELLRGTDVSRTVRADGVVPQSQRTINAFCIECADGATPELRRATGASHTACADGAAPESQRATDMACTACADSATPELQRATGMSRAACADSAALESQRATDMSRTARADGATPESQRATGASHTARPDGAALESQRAPDTSHTACADGATPESQRATDMSRAACADSAAPESQRATGASHTACADGAALESLCTTDVSRTAHASCATPESQRATGASCAARARELWRRIEERVRLVHSDFSLVPDLRAVLKAGLATPLVRDILFAAAARACGIPARLNPADGEKEVWDGAWRPLLPVERGRLRLTNRTGAPRVYGVDFTVGILENGAFRTLNFWGETMAEHWEREVPAGLYRAVHCVRQIDGSVDGELRYAWVTKLGCGEMTLEPLPDRKREKLLHRRLPELRAEELPSAEGGEPLCDCEDEKLRHLPQPCAEELPPEGCGEPLPELRAERLSPEEHAEEMTLPNCTKEESLHCRRPERHAEGLSPELRGELPRRAALPPLGRPVLLAVLEPGAEPTEHFLNEILELRDEMNGVGLELLIARPGQRGNAKLTETLRAVPHARLWTNFDADALLQWRKALDAGDLRLPLAAAFNARGEALFAFTNYNVGSVRALLGCIAADE